MAIQAPAESADSAEAAPLLTHGQLGQAVPPPLLPGEEASPSASPVPLHQARRADLNRPIEEFAYPAFSPLRPFHTVQQALDTIRTRRYAQRIVYFYVLDDEYTLLGVVPTRRLLVARLDQRLEEIMIRNPTALPDNATVMDAMTAFDKHRFLALPVTNADRKLIGVVDIELFTGAVHDIDDRTGFDDVYQLVGVRLSEASTANVRQAYRGRFPWLMATVCSGTAAAVLTGLFEATLSQAIVLAFFLTLVLGLAESISMQSMSIALQRLHSRVPSWRRLLLEVAREGRVAVLLGCSCGLIVGVLAWLLHGKPLAGLVIGASISLSMLIAAMLGLAVPAVMRIARLDPKIASGPITLAATDLATLAIYFGSASLVL